MCAAGGLPGDLHKLWRTSRPGGYHLEYGYSTMGYEVAGGIGVAMAEPDRRVYVMVGDGSWLMLSSEIATAVQEGIGLTVVLLDNHGFRCIRNLSGVVRRRGHVPGLPVPRPGHRAADGRRAAHRLRGQRREPGRARPDRPRPGGAGERAGDEHGR